MSRSLRAHYLLLTVAVTCVPSVAAADSDGYFCSASRLIAFDQFIPAEPGRLIKIVRFDAAGGIYPEEEVKISDDCQTHGMVCRSGTVEVYSWDHVYVLDTSTDLVHRVDDQIKEHRRLFFGVRHETVD